MYPRQNPPSPECLKRGHVPKIKATCQVYRAQNSPQYVKLDIASRRSESPDRTWFKHDIHSIIFFYAFFYAFSAISVKISPKRPKIASVRYFGSLWMTFNEELQGQISACLQRTYIYKTAPH